jgi:RecB family exonuclease
VLVSGGDRVVLVDFGLVTEAGPRAGVDRLDDGRTVVTDFKTGAGKGVNSNTDTQLSIYALALRRVFQINPDLLRLSYVEEARDEETTRTTDDDAHTAQRVEETATRIRSGDFTAKPGFHCRFCDFRNICDFAKLS